MQKYKTQTIVLVGMMGAGKTYVGKSLAAMLGRKFIDLDKKLEERCGSSIPEIFAVEGEDGFRKRESRLLKEFSETEGVVIATGGGVVLREENRKILRNSKALVVHLNINERTCLNRTKGSDRPLLQTPNPMEKIKELIDFRTPLYREVADIEFDANGSHCDRDVLEWLQANGLEGSKND